VNIKSLETWCQDKKSPRNHKMSGEEGTTATIAANTASFGSAEMQQMSSMPSGTIKS